MGGDEGRTGAGDEGGGGRGNGGGDGGRRDEVGGGRGRGLLGLVSSDDVRGQGKPGVACLEFAALQAIRPRRQAG